MYKHSLLILNLSSLFICCTKSCTLLGFFFCFTMAKQTKKRSMTTEDETWNWNWSEVQKHTCSYRLSPQVIKEMKIFSIINQMCLKYQSKNTCCAVKWPPFVPLHQAACYCWSCCRWSWFELLYIQLAGLVQWFPTEGLGPSKGSPDKSEGSWDD